MSLYLTIAVLLLVLGVVGSLIPSVPGPLFSVVGVLLYWWSTGYSVPGNIALFLMVSTALFASVIDLVATYVGARKSGVSNKTAYAGVLAGLVLFFVTGPFGILIGVVGTIFLREYLKGKSQEEALRSSLLSGLALLASTAVKTFLTSLVLLWFLLSVFL